MFSIGAQNLLKEQKMLSSNSVGPTWTPEKGKVVDYVLKYVKITVVKKVISQLMNGSDKAFINGLPANKYEPIAEHLGDQDVSLDDQDVSLDDQDVSLDDQDVSLDDQDVSLDDQDVSLDERLSKYRPYSSSLEAVLTSLTGCEYNEELGSWSDINSSEILPSPPESELLAILNSAKDLNEKQKALIKDYGIPVARLLLEYLQDNSDRSRLSGKIASLTISGSNTDIKLLTRAFQDLERHYNLPVLRTTLINLRKGSTNYSNDSTPKEQNSLNQTPIPLEQIQKQILYIKNDQYIDAFQTMFQNNFSQLLMRWNHHGSSNLVFEDFLIKWLDECIKAGMDINASNAAGNLILHVLSGRIEIDRRIILALTSRGFNINGQNIEGKTILHEAAEADNHKLSEDLLKYGADPCIKNGKGETPLEDIFYCYNDDKLCCLLISFYYLTKLPAFDLPDELEDIKESILTNYSILSIDPAFYTKDDRLKEMKKELEDHVRENILRMLENIALINNGTFAGLEDLDLAILHAQLDDIKDVRQALTATNNYREELAALVDQLQADEFVGQLKEKIAEKLNCSTPEGVRILLLKLINAFEARGDISNILEKIALINNENFAELEDLNLTSLYAELGDIEDIRQALTVDKEYYQESAALVDQLQGDEFLEQLKKKIEEKLNCSTPKEVYALNYKLAISKEDAGVLSDNEMSDSEYDSSDEASLRPASPSSLATEPFNWDVPPIPSLSATTPSQLPDTTIFCFASTPPEQPLERESLDTEGPAPASHLGKRKRNESESGSISENEINEPPSKRARQHEPLTSNAAAAAAAALAEQQEMEVEEEGLHR
jgi:hypothetical protein